ncbi:MAG: dual specificity protein phosphatase family protein [Acidobacteriota bacterium]
MDIICLDDKGCLYLSPKIEDWAPVEEHGITVVIDLEGDLDHCVPTMPNHVLYIYYPIYDEDLPDMAKLEAVVRLGASMVEAGHKVLSHCGMGFNRSALVAGLILHQLGMPGPETVTHLRQRRPGALFNDVFANHLLGLAR